MPPSRSHGQPYGGSRDRRKELCTTRPPALAWCATNATACVIQIENIAPQQF